MYRVGDPTLVLYSLELRVHRCIVQTVPVSPGLTSNSWGSKRESSRARRRGHRASDEAHRQCTFEALLGGGTTAEPQDNRIRVATTVLLETFPTPFRGSAVVFRFSVVLSALSVEDDPGRYQRCLSAGFEHMHPGVDNRGLPAVAMVNVDACSVLVRCAGWFQLRRFTSICEHTASRDSPRIRTFEPSYRQLVRGWEPH